MVLFSAAALFVFFKGSVSYCNLCARDGRRPVDDLTRQQEAKLKIERTCLINWHDSYIALDSSVQGIVIYERWRNNLALWFALGQHLLGSGRTIDHIVRRTVAEACAYIQKACTCRVPSLMYNQTGLWHRKFLCPVVQLNGTLFHFRFHTLCLVELGPTRQMMFSGGCLGSARMRRHTNRERGGRRRRLMGQEWMKPGAWQWGETNALYYSFQSEFSIRVASSVDGGSSWVRVGIVCVAAKLSVRGNGWIQRPWYSSQRVMTRKILMFIQARTEYCEGGTTEITRNALDQSTLSGDRERRWIVIISLVTVNEKRQMESVWRHGN